MQRKLYLVRHAQTVPGSVHVPDDMRPLTPEGETQSTQIGNFLHQKESKPDLIVCSHALRAHQTALAIGRAWAAHIPIQIEKTVYAGTQPEIVKLLSGLSDSVTAVVLVGHYPTLVELHNYLTADKQLIGIKTGELVALTLDYPWAMLSGGMAAHTYTYHPHNLP